MTDTDKLRTDPRAPGATVHRERAGVYSGVIDRYLDAAGHGSQRPSPAVATAATRTGLVLAAVDDTSASHVAVDHAAIEAELRGWHLRLLHVQPASGAGSASRYEGARLLEGLIERVHTFSPSTPVTSRLLTGSVAQRLLIEAHDAGLVVVGHQHGTAGAVAGVSVSDRVAADHTGAVLIVRMPSWPPGPDFGERPVVAGVDGDDSRVVAFAHGEARRRGSDLMLLHACRTPRAARVDTLGGVRMRWRFTGEDPAAALVRESGQAAALVLGRHGRGGIGGGRLGSVARSVIQQAHCPVFVVD